MTEELLDKLISLNIDIELVEGDKLKVHTNIKSIPPELLTEIKLRKEELVTYLTQRHSSTDFVKIPAVDTAPDYALSPNQRRLWLLGQFIESNIAYNIPRVYVFDGNLDRSALEFSFNALIDRHESLRTIFKDNGKGEIRQVICPIEQTGFRVEYHDLRNAKESEKLLQELMQDAFSTPFDFAAGPLIRTILVQMADNKWFFIYVTHHIISDGWSMGILINELLLFYNASTRGEENPLSPLRIHYKDYAAWLQGQLSGKDLDKHKTYWIKQFEGELPVLELPCDKVRPALKTYKGRSVTRLIDSRTSAGIKTLGMESGCTLFMTMLAAVNVLFYKYTDQEDIIIGTPIAGREHIDLENQIGFYVNTLALRTQFSGEDSYRQLLENTKQVTLGAYRHQVYPFDELTDVLNLQRDISRNPLFDIQVIVTEANTGMNAGKKTPGKLAISGYQGPEESGSAFDMVFNFVETVEGLYTNVSFNPDIYSQSRVEQFANHLEQLLHVLIVEPGKPIRELEFLNEKDKHTQLVEFNNNAIVSPGEETIIDLFKEQAKRIPQHTAVVFGSNSLTYRELDKKSDQLATYLENSGYVQPRSLVGVMIDRSEKMLIALLGILKAGGVYVPIDPEYPEVRKKFIINDTGIKTLITQTEYIFDIGFYTGNVFAIDIQLETLNTPAEPCKTSIKPNDLAYIIYTSGSTGDPKGVMIEHTALAVSIQSQQTIFDIKDSERSLQFSSSSFDVSLFEVFITITSGGILYIIDEKDKKDPLLLQQFIVENKIDIASIPPAYLALLDIEEIKTLKKLVTGGEQAVYEKVRSFSKYGTYYNAYGPTESSLCASVFRVNKGMEINETNIPIGNPIPGIQLYITNDRDGLLPLGATGEICIGGAGLARGYLNNPELTATKFVANPFRKGEKMYRTGDLGRWLPNGNMEFIGRKDAQVKIHGYRVEPGEIEHALQNYPEIESVAVISKANKSGNNELIAYLVSRETINVSDLISFLGRYLPAYMLPGHFVQLDKLPITPNGKVDRKKLPDPEGLGMSTGTEYVAPRTETERKILRIWQEVLDKEKIGIKDDYFELGGSSLKAMVVSKKITDEMGVSVPIKIIFEQKNIESIAAYIDQSCKIIEPLPGITPQGKGEAVTDASYNQLIYFSEWNKEGGHLVVNAYEFDHINGATFKQAVNRLIERHEILRTVFIPADGTVKQNILPAEKVNYEMTDAIPVSPSAEMNEIIAKEYFRKFDLSIFPLFEIKIYRLKKGNYIILVTMHHIITDGYSGGVLKNDLMQLYAEIEQKEIHTLKPLLFQYRDFSNWQRRFLESEEGIGHREYWLKKLNGLSQKINLPVSRNPLNHKGGLVGLPKTIDGLLYREMDQFVKKEGITLTTLFMGSLLIMLNQFSKQDDITICTNVSGRNSRYYGKLDVSGLIGFFANLLLVRNVINKTKSVRELLLGVQSNFLDDLHHDAYPVDKLINELPGIVPATFLNSTVFYNYHNYDYQKKLTFKIGKTEKEERRPGDSDLRMSFGLGIAEFKNCLTLRLLFNESFFDEARRKGIRDIYFSILKQIIAKPGMLINDMKLSRKEKAILTL